MTYSQACAGQQVATPKPQPKRAFKGVWIPKELLEAEALSPFQVILLANIDSLDGGEGCFASNEHLAKLMKSNTASIRVMLSKLKKEGWLEVVNEEGENRLLRVVVKPVKPLMAVNGALMAVNGGVNGHYSTIYRESTDRVQLEGSLFPSKESEGAKAKEKKTVSPNNIATDILQHLNLSAGRSFRLTDGNLALIEARLKSIQNDVQGVKQMINRQVSLWKGDPKMEEFLRPETLFGKTKFDSYYDCRTLPVKREEEVARAKQFEERRTLDDLADRWSVHPANPRSVKFDRNIPQTLKDEGLQIYRTLKAAGKI